MKKFFASLFVIVNFFIAYSQDERIWFNLAVKGSYGSSILFNSMVQQDGSIYTYYFNPSYCFGGNIGINFPGGLSIRFEIMSSSFTQKYDVDILNITVTKNMHFTGLEKNLLLYAKGNNGYIESGVQFRKLTKYSETNSSALLIENTINNFQKKQTGLIVGFGILLYDRTVLDITLGLRGVYTFTDIINGEDPPTSDPIFAPHYKEAKTNPFVALFILEFNWHVGYFATSSCKRKTGFLFFK